MIDITPQAAQQNTAKVTVANFVRAESDHMFRLAHNGHLRGCTDMRETPERGFSTSLETIQAVGVATAHVSGIFRQTETVHRLTAAPEGV